MYNAKSFAVPILVFFFVLHFNFVAVFGRIAKGFLGKTYHLLPSKDVTNVGLISLETLKDISAKAFLQVFIQEVCSTWHDLRKVREYAQLRISCICGKIVVFAQMFISSIPQ